MTKHIDVDGKVTNYKYGDNDNITEIATSEEETITSYDSLDRKRKVIIPNKEVIGYDYDEVSNLKEIFRKKGEEMEIDQNEISKFILGGLINNPTPLNMNLVLFRED